MIAEGMHKLSGASIVGSMPLSAWEEVKIKSKHYQYIRKEDCIESHG